MKLGNRGPQAFQSAGQVAVEIELIPRVNSNSGIGMPKNNTVVAAKVALGLVQKFMDLVSAAAAIVEPFVACHEKSTRVIAGGPGKLRPAVKTVVVVKAGPRFFTPL